MRKIPCRKCDNCGRYNDLAVLECECGEDISMLDTMIVDIDNLRDDEIGEIDEELKVYMQKCSACGALNFTFSDNEPVKMCYNCHKTRIATVVPVEYVDEERTEMEAPVQMDYNIQQEERNVGVEENAAEDEEDEDDEDSLQWQSILGEIKGVVQREVPKNIPVMAETAKTENTAQDKRKDAEASSQSITLIAVRYGHFSYTVKSVDTPFLLGRDANLKDFLEQDGRVSNEHCILYFRAGSWFVKDNHSTNGTAVNSRDIGLNGEHELCDGDELKLGHHQDSMAFRIIID